MKKSLSLFIVTIFFMTCTFSQEEKIKAFSIIDAGVEFQVYPTGYMPAIKIATNISKKDALNFRLGMNIFDHQDFPMQNGINNHISEIGYGFGFSIGYKHYFWKNVKNLFVGIRSDVWFNTVHWKKTAVNFPNIGTSNIIVVQPTFEAGWLFEIGKNKNFIITPEIAFGYEWNAVVNGEQTGYGAILLGGITAGYRFNKN